MDRGTRTGPQGLSPPEELKPTFLKANGTRPRDKMGTQGETRGSGPNWGPGQKKQERPAAHTP